MYIYIQDVDHPGINYLVGFYLPGTAIFLKESEHASIRSAAARVNYLNGGTGEPLK